MNAPLHRGSPNQRRAYPIQPTPTFNFSDEIDFTRQQQRRAPAPRSSGGMLLLVLMLLAGSAGYVAVKYRVWEDSAPLVQRARELAQSLRSLAPSASPDLPASAKTVEAPAPIAPRLEPEVVPITRTPETAMPKTPTPKAPPAATAAATTASATRAPTHRRRDRGRATSTPLKAPSKKVSAGSLDMPTEDELLAPPPGRR